MDFNDLYIGAGYRKQLSESFCAALMLHGGYSFCDYRNVAASTSTPGSFALEGRSSGAPVVKLTSFYEFYIDPKFCVFLTAGYAQQLGTGPFADNFAEGGSVLLSLGFTAAIF